MTPGRWMKQLQAKVGRIIEGDAEAGAAAAALLSIASAVYGGGVRLRGACYDTGLFEARRLPCPVVSIGNITAGGTGKTPMAIYMAKTLKQLGYHPAVLSRGYKGQAEVEGAIVSDGHRLLCGPDAAGDEAFMMASKLPGIPVLVGGNRYKSGRRAIGECNADVMVLDDGFQHRRLHRDLDLVLLDARQCFGNGSLLPRGVLREPVSALDRSHALVLTRSVGEIGAADALRRRYPNKPVFQSDHQPYVAGIFDGAAPLTETAEDSTGGQDLTPIQDAEAYVFSGIARNREFAEMLEKQGVKVKGRRAFSDHHPYTDTELETVVRSAESSAAQMLVTTEKDYVRIAGRVVSRLPLAVVGVRIVFCDKNELEFRQWIRDGVNIEE